LRKARQIDRWSRGDSVIHRRHAAVKILATLVLLISIATVTEHTFVTWALYLVLLVIAVLAARLPVFAMLRGAAVILPFAMGFAFVSALAGDPERAIVLVIRGYLSALAALLLIATTPMPDLIGGLESLHAPAFLLQVMQFLYRYLIVLAEEAGAMRQATLARAGSIRVHQFRQAGAAAGVLFARSWARAQAVYGAMISRGFEGHIPTFARARFQLADAGFVTIATLLIVSPRIVFR
jgi:cobalt/nickel transport system permease protein